MCVCVCVCVCLYACVLACTCVRVRVCRALFPVGTPQVAQFCPVGIAKIAAVPMAAHRVSRGDSNREL